LASATLDGADMNPIAIPIAPTAISIKEAILSLFEKVYILSVFVLFS